MSVLGLDREVAMWDTPLATLLRLQAAYAQRHGQNVNWQAGRLDRVLELLEQMEIANGGDPEGQDNA